MDENWKGVLSRNFSAIVGHVDDPDAIAECLHYDWNPPVFTENDVQQVKSSTEDNKSKTRRLLNKLTYKTNYPLVALYNAFKLTSNVFLRELLVPYVQSYYKAQRTDIRIIPASRLPLQKDDWEDFHKKDVIMCEIESQNLLENYKDTVKNYMMTKETRGRAVIVNNFNFAGKKNRDGSDMDVRLLSNTLAQLHFDVKVHQDLTAEQIKTELERESRLEDHKSAQCFILVVMSHGTADGVEGTKEEVVPFQEFAIIFNPDNCPALKDKPKLFFFQSCRRKGPGISIDPNPRRMKEAMNNKDFLFAFATVQGFEALRCDDTGAWFIQALCWVLKYESQKLHVLEMLTKVNALVSEMEEDGQSGFFVPEYRGSLVKNVHFFPGVFGEQSNPLKNEKVGKIVYSQ